MHEGKGMSHKIESQKTSFSSDDGTAMVKTKQTLRMLAAEFLKCLLHVIKIPLRTATIPPALAIIKAMHKIC